MQVAADLLAIIVGVAVIIFRRPVARFTVKMQNRTWGFTFGERTETFTRTVAIPVVGVVFVAVGVMLLIFDT